MRFGKLKRFLKPRGAFPTVPFRRPSMIMGMVPPTRSARKLTADIRTAWAQEGLGDDGDMESGGFLDNLGSFLNQAAGAYKTYTGAQQAKDAADAAKRLEAQRAAAARGALMPTAGNFMSTSIFGIPLVPLVLVGGGLLAWKLMKKR